MEVVPAGPSYRPIMWLCVSNLVPLIIITQVLKAGSWPANPIAIMIVVELLKAVISFLLKATSSSSSFSSTSSHSSSSSHASSYQQGQSSIGSTRSALAAPGSSNPSVDFLPLQDTVGGDSDNAGSSHEHSPRPLANKKRLFAQIAGLSILYTGCNLGFFYLLSSIPSTSFSLIQTLSTLTSGLIGVFFLNDTITSTQILVLLLHLAAITVAQWDACGGGAISTFGSLLGVLVLTFAQQIAHIWHQSLIRSSGHNTFWISTFLSLFSIPSLIWAWFTFPIGSFDTYYGGQFIPTPSTTFLLAIILILTSASLLHAHLLSSPSFPDVSSNSPFLVASPLISMAILYTLDSLFWHRTYITLTVVIALMTVAICAYSFFAFSDDSVVRLRLTFRRNAIDLSSSDTDDGTRLGTVTTIATNLLPDFVTVKCGWRQVLAGICLLVVILLFVEGGRGHGSYASTVLSGVLGNGEITNPSTDQAAPSNADSKLTPSAPVTRVIVREPSSTKLKTGATVEYFGTNDEKFYNWQSRPEDEEVAVYSLMETLMAARGSETLKKKSVAVCLGGYFYDDFEAHDLDWLHAFYSMGASHDVFVWQGHESVPFATGKIHPKATSLLRSNGPPLGMHRRYLNKQYDNEFWAYHMHGWNHCVSMIRDHSAAQGISYDFMLIARPTTPLQGHPIPHFSTWDKTSITFPPHIRDRFPENMFWGPYKMVADFVPYLHSSLISYAGDRTPYIYARKLAQIKGFKIKELPTW